MSAWEDFKETVRIVESIKDLRKRVEHLEAKSESHSTRLAVVESREDAIIMASKEGVRELLNSHERRSNLISSEKED